MKKAKDAIKRMLKEQWEQACNGFLVELLRMWELDAHYGYWNGDETGGVYDYGDGMLTINMDDIIYCVLSDVTREQFEEWQQYICDASEFGFATPNLRSFVRGCPRTPAETFQHLRELKATLNDAIRDEKERMKNGKQNNPYCNDMSKATYATITIELSKAGIHAYCEETDEDCFCTNGNLEPLVKLINDAEICNPDTRFSLTEKGRKSLNDLTAEDIQESLDRNNGDRKAAAQQLGMSDRTLYRRMKQYGII